MRISTAKKQKTLDKFIASWKVTTRNNRDWPAMHDISRHKHGIRFFRRVRTPHATWNVWVHLVHHQLTLSGSESYVEECIQATCDDTRTIYVEIVEQIRHTSVHKKCSWNASMHMIPCRGNKSSCLEIIHSSLRSFVEIPHHAHTRACLATLVTIFRQDMTRCTKQYRKSMEIIGNQIWLANMSPNMDDNTSMCAHIWLYLIWMCFYQ